ncbi:DNA mismatch repair protein MLH3 [Penicillium rolfsii]|nr:DNA mismatch repair protein MLH3 [Penicillium rolfsii]
MSSHGPIIQTLPLDVAAKIESSTSITHLHGVVVDLVKNSLDAGAQTILVSVDFKRGNCIVEDDGEGIRPAEFEATGGLGKPHHTSKHRTPGAYGHRGLFLASLASLSLLTVTSRHVQHGSTNSVIFHHARPVARLTPAPAHQGPRLGEHGTYVAVNDLFGNMPVRVKSRALALEKPEELEREWDYLKYMLISLALANGQLSKLVVSDVAREKRITVHPRTPPQGASLNNDPLEMDLGRIGSVLLQSGTLDSRNMDSWHVISASIPRLTIHAAISTVPSPSKKIQFISLGKDPILSRNSSNVLFNEVNRLMSMSDFGNTRSASDIAISKKSAPGIGRSGSFNSMTGRNLAKPVNKWPMFYIRIETESLQRLEDNEEVSPATEKSLQEILEVLEAMILEFLKQHNMRPRARRQGKLFDRSHRTKTITRTSSARSDNAAQSSRNLSMKEGFDRELKIPSFQRSKSANIGPHFSNWSRVKSAKEPEDLILRTGVVGTEPVGENDRPSQGARLTSCVERRRNQLNRSQYFPPSDQSVMIHDNLVSTSRAIGEVQQHEPEHVSSESAFDEMISWVDPYTGKTHQINSRTGQTVNLKANSAGSRSNSFPGSLQGLGRSQRRRSASSSSFWVDNLLDAWNNPTFARTEVPVPNLDVDVDHLQNQTRSHHCHEDIGALFGTQVAKFRGKLQRQSLASATVIAQVDHKFILAKFDPTQPRAAVDPDFNGVLVLIDQHAADERCRVEKLFEDMFISPGSSNQHDQIRTVEIDPIRFNISATEAALFRKYLDFFGNWGFAYDMNYEAVSKVTVQVHTLPTLVAERCRLEPNLIVDLLRREIWNLEEENGKPLGSKGPTRKFSMGDDDSKDFSSHEEGEIAAHPWVQKMSGCPQSILDLLNSRACRGAIMFNDPLNIQECEALVKRLSRCAFPFQCAHGRPSMIPILDLRSQPGSGPPCSNSDMMDLAFDEHEDELGFLRAFRARYVL